MDRTVLLLRNNLDRSWSEIGYAFMKLFPNRPREWGGHCDEPTRLKRARDAARARYRTACDRLGIVPKKK